MISGKVKKSMKFQLVIQFAASGQKDFSDLLEFAERISVALSDEAETVVDGYDFGSGEFNIFIHTNQPRAILEKARKAIDTQLPGLPFSSGYRDFHAGKYIPLWPPDLQIFCVA